MTTTLDGLAETGRRLRAVRERIGITQEVLAAGVREVALGLSHEQEGRVPCRWWVRQTISEVERGNRPITVEEAMVLAFVLRCDMAEIVPLLDFSQAV